MTKDSSLRPLSFGTILGWTGGESRNRYHFRPVLTPRCISKYSRIFPRDGCVFERRYLVSSMVSGLCVATAMNPLDVISTRLYTQGTGVTERYTGVLDCGVKTFRAEGLTGVSVRGSKSFDSHVMMQNDGCGLRLVVKISSWF